MLTNYHNKRNKYRPKNLKVIFILESPPVSGKYFYDETGKATEPLFSAMMKLIKFEPQSKEEGLKHFAESGYFIVDATYKQVNQMNGKNRNNTILNDYEKLVADLKTFGNPSSLNLILVKANICRLLEQKLIHDGFNVLNGGAIIPFPSHGHQNRFQVEIRKILP